MTYTASIRWLLMAIGVLIPWQLFVNVHNKTDLPVIFLLLLIITAVMLLFATLHKSSYRSVLKSFTLAYSIFLAGIMLAVFIFENNNLYESLNVLGRLSVGLIILLCIDIAGRHITFDSTFRNRLLSIVVLSSLPLGLIGLYLCLYPELEMPWLESIAGILVEPDSVQQRNNVMSLYKTGVVFVNTNVGAIYWGLLMWTTLWLRNQSTGDMRKIMTIAALTYCANVIASGSRAAMLALFVTILIAFLVGKNLGDSQNVRTELQKNIRLILWVMMVILIFDFIGITNVLLPLILRTADEFSLEFGLMAGERLKLWMHSLTLISKSPLLGYGVIDFSSYGFLRGLPPHNLFLIIWIYGGLTSFVAMIYILFNLYFCAFREIYKQHNVWLLFILPAWFIVQGMFTNLFISNYRVSMLFWFIVMTLLTGFRQKYVAEQ